MAFICPIQRFLLGCSNDMLLLGTLIGTLMAFIHHIQKLLVGLFKACVAAWDSNWDSDGLHSPLSELLVGLFKACVAACDSDWDSDGFHSPSSELLVGL